MMNRVLTVQGFGLSPEEAAEDLERRCLDLTERGWAEPGGCTIGRGLNPYAVVAVHGYVATTTLRMEVRE